MSRGLGKLQREILGSLQHSKEPMTLTEIIEEQAAPLSWGYDNKTAKTKRKRRSIASSVARAMRGLVKADLVRTNSDGAFYPVDWPRRKQMEEWTDRTAYHEAGHAVVGLAYQLPVTAAIAKPDGGGGSVYHRHSAQEVGKMHRWNRRKWDFDLIYDASGVDAFGNPVEKVEMTEAQRHGDVVMCIAGGMAEIIGFGGEPSEWKKKASSADIDIARHQRRKLGDKAKSWEQYEVACLAKLQQFWPMVEAVAERLKKDQMLPVNEIESICRRVARRQHLKTGKAQPI